MTLLGTTTEGKKWALQVVKVAASTVNVTVTFAEFARVAYVISCTATVATGITLPTHVTAPGTGNLQATSPTGNQIGLTLTTNSAGQTLVVEAIGE